MTALSGSSSAVERQLPKLDVAGSIPVSRSISIPSPFSTVAAKLKEDHVFFIFIHRKTREYSDGEGPASRA